MVLRYFKIASVNPNFQCGLAAAYFGGACAVDCRHCAQMAASHGIWQVHELLERYPEVVRKRNGRGSLLRVTARTEALSEAELQTEINLEHPVLAGISTGSGAGVWPPGLSEHAVLLIGYKVVNATMFVYVADPFPYAAAGRESPYEEAGGEAVSNQIFLIDYDTLTDDLGWENSVLVERRR